ncbi:MAG: hypothetical protein J6S07_06660 [Bacteroidaceae bacterium]|nr:hypothetical protein [Bacteroidaceae bacterium]
MTKWSVYIVFFFLFLALLSACRASRSVDRAMSATLSADTRHSRVADICSLSHRLSGMSLQADSIVIWMMAETMSEDLGLSLPSISKGDSTAPWDSGAVANDGKKKNGAVAKGKPALTKVIVSGVRIDASSQEKRVSSSSVRDSSSSLVNNDVKSSEETTVVSSHACARIYIILGIIIAFGVLYIRKRIIGG